MIILLVLKKRIFHVHPMLVYSQNTNNQTNIKRNIVNLNR